MLTALSDGDKRTIYHAALQVLAHTGMTLQHDDAVELLKDAGSQPGCGWRITIPATLVVEKAIASAPANIPLFNREGEQVMDLGAAGPISATARISCIMSTARHWRGRSPLLKASNAGGPGVRCPAQHRFHYVLCHPA
jgi:trimethylamine:corrinoid methyltransferase-like protein